MRFINSMIFASALCTNAYCRAKRFLHHLDLSPNKFYEFSVFPLFIITSFSLCKSHLALCLSPLFIYKYNNIIYETISIFCVCCAAIVSCYIIFPSQWHSICDFCQPFGIHKKKSTKRTINKFSQKSWINVQTRPPQTYNKYFPFFLILDVNSQHLTCWSFLSAVISHFMIIITIIYDSLLMLIHSFIHSAIQFYNNNTQRQST